MLNGSKEGSRIPSKVKLFSKSNKFNELRYDLVHQIFNVNQWFLI